MSRFEVLCTTMHQKDFSKISEMNIRSDVVFANQADRYSYGEMEFDGHKAKMISTALRGVGRNRNTLLIHATADICLMSDDDIVYFNDYEQKVLNAFDNLPQADVIIFNLTTECQERPQYQNKKVKRMGRFSRNPYGACRIAFRRASLQKANVWFTLLFGGGCIFPSGEDSKFIKDLVYSNINVYVHPEVIGIVKFENSTWFTGASEKFYYGKGAYYAAVHPKTQFLRRLYFSWRTSKRSQLSFKERMRWMRIGANGYKGMSSYEEYIAISDIKKSKFS